LAIPSYQAIVIGATGAVGGALVRSLLQSPSCARVVALSRRPFNGFDMLPGREKLDFRVIDYRALERATSDMAAGCQSAFCTVGIGQPRKVSKEEFWRVDVGYAGGFASGTVSAGVHHISLLSAVGANVHARNRYMRTKGAAEEAVIGSHHVSTSIFRPSLLVTKEIRYGVQDRLTQALFPIVSTMLPSRFHEVTVEALGHAMRLNAEAGGAPGVRYLYYADYASLLRQR
jgi:uncharacterized protein YbjT (DUF2867 family)